MLIIPHICKKIQVVNHKNKLNYRPEIDGLRTLAVLPVILFHLDYSFIKGGYYGVDVFFVISGYLITSILAKSISEEKFSMYNFWIKRVKRLFPMILTVILVTVLCSLLFSLYKPLIKNIAVDSFPAMFSYFNFHALYSFEDYWSVDANNSFFLHTWSLSVEEQFYLIYPFFLFLSYKYLKSIRIPLLVLTLCSFFAFLYYLNVNKEFAFYMLPTRIWELSMGGLLIFSPKIQNKYKNLVDNIITLLGFLLIGVGYFYGNNSIDAFAILPVIGSVLIIAFCSEHTIFNKILSNNAISYIGKLSFSLYLWHWVVILFFKNTPELLAIYNKPLILLVTFTISIVSYHFIENVFRNYNHTPKIVLVGIILISTLCFYLKSDYFNIKYRNNFKPNTTTSIIDYEQKKNTNALYENGISTSINNSSPEVLILGDSHAVSLATSLNSIFDELKISRTFFCKSGLRANINLKHIENQVAFPHDQDLTKWEKIKYAKALKKNIDGLKLKLVIISMRWDLRKINEFNELFNYITNEKQIKLLIINQPPMVNFSLLKAGENIEQKLSYKGYGNQTGIFNTYVNFNGESIAQNNIKVLNYAKLFPKTYVFDSYSLLTHNKKMLLIKDNMVFYKDTNHLSEFGANFIKPNLKAFIVTVLNDTNF